MPELSEVGLRAVLENVDGFEAGAKRLETAYGKISTAEALAASASEQNAAVIDQTAQAASQAAGQIEEISGAIEGMISPETQARIEKVYEAMGKVSPEAEKSVRALGASLGKTEQDAEQFATRFENVMKTAQFAVAGIAGKYSEFQQRISDTAAFERIERAYDVLGRKSPELVADLREQQEEWIAAGGAAEEWADAVQQVFGQTVAQIQQGSDQASNALQTMVNIISLGALREVTGTLGGVGDRLVGLAKDATMAAARVEELDLVLGNLAEKNDLSAAAMRNQVQAIRDQGIQADVAYGLVSQFVRSNLDLSKASTLARIAQDAAVISMEDSSQALQGLLHGILTLQPEILRYRGIIVDLQSEYKRWAEANNRTTLSMTGAEKQMVALEAVIAQGASIAGTYESAMESASKQLRSFPRYINDLKVEFGNALLPAYSDAIFATKDLIKEISGIPEPVKAATAVIGTMTGGLFKGTSALLGFATQAGYTLLAVQNLMPQLEALGVTAKLASVSFLGPVGLAAGLAAVVGIGVVTALKTQEEALRATASQTLAGTDSYAEYVIKMREVELASFTLSEGLYEIAKSADAAAQGLDAVALTEAFRDLDMAIGGTRTGIEALDEILVSMNQSGEGAMDQLRVSLERIAPDLNDAQVVVLQNADAVRRLGENAGYSGQDLRDFTQIVLEFAEAQSIAREEAAKLQQFIGWAEQGKEPWQEMATAADEAAAATARAVAANEQYEGVMPGMISYEQELLIAQAARYEQLLLLAKAQEDYSASLEGIAARGAAQILRAEEQKNASILRAEQSLTDQLGSLWDGYADRVTGIMEQLADVEANLQAGLAAAQQQYLADRLAAEQSYAQSVAQLQTDLAAQEAQLATDLQQRLDDLRRGYEEAQANAASNLARDLEDINRDHLARMAAMEADHYANIETLAEQHEQNLLSIQEAFDRQREAIEEKYRTEPTEEEKLDAERERLLRELERLRELQAGGMTGIDWGASIEEILRQLDELKQQELDALDEQQAAEEEAEEQAHQERLQAEQDRWEEAQAAEEARWQEARDERQAQYEQELEDLRLANERAQDEARRANQQALDALRQRTAEERAELEARYREQLAALEERLREERQKLTASAAEQRTRLQEQLRTEQSNYQERRDELKEHNRQQIQATEEQYKEQLKEIQDGLLLQKLKIIDGLSEQSTEFAQAYKDEKEALEDYLFGEGGRYQQQHDLEQDVLSMLGNELPNQTAAFANAYTVQRNDLYEHLFGANGLLGMWTQYFGDLANLGDTHSPSGWMIQFGRDLTTGLLRGLDLGAALGRSLAQFSEFKGEVEAQIPNLQLLAPDLQLQAPDLATGISSLQLPTPDAASVNFEAAAVDRLTYEPGAGVGELSSSAIPLAAPDLVLALDNLAHILQTQAACGGDRMARLADPDWRVGEITRIMRDLYEKSAHSGMLLPTVTVQAPTVAAPVMPPGPTNVQNTTNYNLTADFTNSNMMPGILSQFRMLEMSRR